MSDRKKFDQANKNIKINTLRLQNLKDNVAQELEYLLEQINFSADITIDEGIKNNIPIEEWEPIAQEKYKNPDFNFIEYVWFSKEEPEHKEVTKPASTLLISHTDDFSPEGMNDPDNTPPVIKNTKKTTEVNTDEKPKTKKARRKWKVILNEVVEYEGEPICRHKEEYSGIEIVKTEEKTDKEEKESVLQITM